MTVRVRKGTPQAQAKKRPRLLPGRVLGIVLLLLLAWDILGPYGAWKLFRIRAEKDQVVAANIEMAKTNGAVQERINRLKTDSRYQEELVRHQLGWVRDGEILYDFVSESK